MTTEISEMCLRFGYSLPSSECASWVQAWGSIGAILVTLGVVLISHWLRKNQRNVEENVAEIRFLEGVFQLVGGVRGTASKIVDIEKMRPGTPYERAMMRAELHTRLGALQRIDLARLYRYELLSAASIAESNVRLLLYSLDRVSAAGFSEQLDKGYLAAVAAAALESIDPQSAKLYQLVTAAGGDPVVDALFPVKTGSSAD